MKNQELFINSLALFYFLYLKMSTPYGNLSRHNLHWIHSARLALSHLVLGDSTITIVENSLEVIPIICGLFSESQERMTAPTISWLGCTRCDRLGKLQELIQPEPVAKFGAHIELHYLRSCQLALSHNLSITGTAGTGQPQQKSS